MTHDYPKKHTKGIHYHFTVGPLAFGNLLFGTFLLSLCLPLLLEREEGAAPLPSHGVTPKIDGDCSLYSSSCRCHASTSYDVMSILWSHAYVIGCCAGRALLTPPSPFLSLLTQLKTEEHAERRRAEMGGRGTGEKRRPIQVASTETDGQADRQWEEERDKPIEDRLALSGVKER